jgi:dipeptidyl aminopeptidase/acylaminoacyl peptidase
MAEPDWRSPWTVDEHPRAIGLVSAEGGPVRDRGPESGGWTCSPTWTPDGRSLYFVSARAGGAVNRIYRHDLDWPADSVVEVVGGVQPSVSPDGRELAYVSGGLRVLDLESGESRLVRSEETAFRMRPRVDTRRSGRSSTSRTTGDPTTCGSSRRPAGAPSSSRVDDETPRALARSVSPDGEPLRLRLEPPTVPRPSTPLDIAGGRPSAWHGGGDHRARRPVRAGRGQVRIRDPGPGRDRRCPPGSTSMRATAVRTLAEGGLPPRHDGLRPALLPHPRARTRWWSRPGPPRLEALRGFEYRPRV